MNRYCLPVYIIIFHPTEYPTPVLLSMRYWGKGAVSLQVPLTGQLMSLDVNKAVVRRARTQGKLFWCLVYTFMYSHYYLTYDLPMNNCEESYYCLMPRI